jgi:thiamine biosynthesis lipoprotein
MVMVNVMVIVIVTVIVIGVWALRVDHDHVHHHHHVGIALVLLWGCDRPQEAAASPAIEAPAPERTLVERSRKAMGTIWKMSALAAPADHDKAGRALTQALDEVDRLEALLSEWRPTSELSRLNAAAGEAPVKVGAELLACIETGLEVARWSEGAYDISWAALHGVWDFSPTSRHVPPSREAIAARLPLWNWKNIAVDHGASTVFLKKRGMALGLGGIAKGYALDSAASLLHAAGFHDFLLFGGGQVRVGGKRGDRPWRVGIQHPRAPEKYFGFVEVEGDKSVSTSGDYEHSFVHEGKRYHHILDPKTGFPSEKSASVTVVSPNALWADAVDTALFVLGPEAAMAALAAAPGGPHEAVLVSPALELFVTPGMENRLILKVQLVDGRLP